MPEKGEAKPRGFEAGKQASQGGEGDMGKIFVAGSTEFCICPACGTRIAHRTGIPCFMEKCPKCGAAMTPYNPLPPYNK
jgi:hypothetical protein